MPTLEQLENNYWGTAPNDSSSLVKKCHELRKKDIEFFTVEDFRILIGQSIGLNHLMPKATRLLKKTY